MNNEKFSFAKNLQKIFFSLKNVKTFKESILTSIETKNLILVPSSKFFETANPALKGSTKFLRRLENTDKNSISFRIFDKKFNFLGYVSVKNFKEQKNSIVIEELVLLKEFENFQLEVISKLFLWLKNRFTAESIFVDKSLITSNITNFFIFTNFNKNIFQIEKKKLIKKNEKILTAGPLVTNYEKIFVQDAAENGWNENSSKYIKNFESEFRSMIDCKYSIATSSCTGSLYLSLLAAGIGKGDEVIVPEITWVATASAVKYTGATPVFADIDKDTWTISLESIKELYSEKTAAIIPVHLYGNASQMTEIINFSKSKGIKVIEDAAPAIGATYNGKKLGTFGDFGCFSFQGAKLLVTGEGGMIVTNSKKNFEKIVKLNDHGRVPGSFWINKLGYKFKISNLQAAFGLGQLKNLDQMIYSKRKIYQRYLNNLKDLDSISFIKETKNSESIFWMTSFTIKDNEKSVSELMNFLSSKNIDTRPVFPPISQYPIWNNNFKPKPNAKFIGENSLNLPSGVMLTETHIDFVSDMIIKFFKK